MRSPTHALTAGVLASLVSHLVVARIRFPRLIAALTKSNSTPEMVSRAERLMRPSLGASGAVYASLAVTALAYPHAQVYLIFLPMIPISISVGFGGMLLADVIGLWRGWGYVFRSIPVYSNCLTIVATKVF
jgi:rhomboid-like protein